MIWRGWRIFFFQAEDGIRDYKVTGVQTCALPILLPRVVPCLDVRDGRGVKGVQFQHLRDAGDPASQAALYESQGADEIVVLDVAASAEGGATQVEPVARGRAAGRSPLPLGGGVREGG